MSEEQDPKVVRERPNPYAEEYDDYGNSITSLRENLRLTPMQRLLKAQSAANSVLELKKHAPRPRD